MDEAKTKRSAGQIGCLVLAVPIFVVLSPVVLIMTAWEDWRGDAIARRFRRLHPGKLGILVYSNSPNWQSYIEDNWIPAYGRLFVVLNWSERATWKERFPFEASLFRRYTSATEYNPVVIVIGQHQGLPTFRAWLKAIREVEPLGMLAPSSPRVRVVRFWKAFRDYKHGKPHALRKAEAELAAVVQESQTV